MPSPAGLRAVTDPGSATLFTTEFARYGLIVLAAIAGGAINSIAGGGTLITFPALVGLGIPPLTANATNTVALWPASLGSAWAYRSQLTGTHRWALLFAVPSVIGGFVGALLLLLTPGEQFEAVVPWLVLGATVLFMSQSGLTSRAADSSTVSVDPSTRSPTPVVYLFQFGVAVYGGYFGAGIGILMLAVLGFMGFSNIHRMNGLKNWAAFCINAVAAGTFAVTGLVNWPAALAMTAGGIAGGYFGARLAQRVPRDQVRRAVVVIGLASGVWLAIR